MLFQSTAGDLMVCAIRRSQCKFFNCEVNLNRRQWIRIDMSWSHTCKVFNKICCERQRLALRWNSRQKWSPSCTHRCLTVETRHHWAHICRSVMGCSWAMYQPNIDGNLVKQPSPDTKVGHEIWLPDLEYLSTWKNGNGCPHLAKQSRVHVTCFEGHTIYWWELVHTSVLR